MTSLLLLACRSIYREAIYLPYTSNIFFISDLSILIDWAGLPLLRLQHFAEIRHLSVRWIYYSGLEHFRGSAPTPYDWRTWSRFWEIVATRMPALKKLKLRMEYLGRGEEVGVEKEWVIAMVGVRRIKEVTVAIVFRTNSWAGDRYEVVKKVLSNAWSQEGYRPREDQDKELFGLALASCAITARLHSLLGATLMRKVRVRRDRRARGIPPVYMHLPERNF